MENEKQYSSILSEHKRVVSTRYTLALINFVAILLGTLVTLFFVQRRGIYAPLLLHIYALIGINALQILLCLSEFVLRQAFGKAPKALPIVAYVVGALWVGVTVSEMVFATIEIGTLRLDLLIVAAIQFVIAIVAYLVWPMMDRRAIDSMIRPSVRENQKKKAKKSRGFVVMYGIICGFIVLAQAATLLAYKMPPQFYDLFADTRAVQYKYDKSMDGYIVEALYQGTAKTVNIPATYNNKPVVGIASGALVDQNVLEKYKLTEITFGTETVDASGNTTVVSNLFFIAEKAIVNNNIETLSIPATVERIDAGAISSTSLKTINYSAAARFSYDGYDCSGLETIIMSGNNVGTIASLEGMSSSVSIKVDKDIYNNYRQANMDYGSSFSPILAEDEFYIDFFTGCDYYIDSIFCKIGEVRDLRYSDLHKDGNTATPLSVDTEAYIKNPHELNTNGAKPDSAFRGWYTDAAFTNEFHFSESGSDTIDKNIKLYAKWIPEYTGILDWGTYTPVPAEMKDNAAVVTELHWTDEDVIDFPVVSNRAGYTGGVTWSFNDQVVTNSQNISENITLNATWNLDAPTLTLDQNEITAITQSSERVQFVYDENTLLVLTPNHSHVLEDDRKNQYTYEWVKSIVKEGQTELAEDKQYAAYQEIQNYVSGGDYTLTVTFESPWGEKASSTVDVTVDILKKPIILSADFNLTGKNVIYDGQTHDLVYTGQIQSDNIQATYRYYDENNNIVSEGITGNTGVKNVGNYKVEAVFQKNNDIEAANYEVKTLKADLVILPKVITVTGWTDDSDFVYNGTNFSCTATISGLVPGDDPGLTYENSSAKNAGTHKAAIVDWTNKNYSLDLTDTRCKNTWTIQPKVLNVGTWQTVSAGWTNFSIVYDGKPHSVEATCSGVVAGDTVSFTYSSNTATNANADNTSYTATITGTTNPNYTFNRNASNLTREWRITKRPLSIVFDNPTLTYTGATQNVNATVSNFVSADKAILDRLTTAADIFSYKADSLTVANVTVSPISGTDFIDLKVPFGAKNAGTYKATIETIISGEIGKNYTVTTAEKTFTINQRSLAISEIAESTGVYSGQYQTLYLAVDNIVAADLASFNLGHFTSNVGIATAQAKNGKFMLGYQYKDAAEYSVIISAFSGNNNYKLAASATKKLTIDKRTLTIANWKIQDKATGSNTNMTGSSFTYNQAGYTVDYTLSGVQAGENVVLTITGATGVNVGSYTTKATLGTASAANKNYHFEEQTKSWSITKYKLNVTWTFDKTGTSFVYDGTTRTATPSYKPLGNDQVTLSYTGHTGKNAASYTINISSVSNANYEIGTGKTLSWTITKRPLTLKWTVPSNAIYNGQYQGPSFEFAGLMNGDVATLKFTINANDLVEGTATKTKELTLSKEGAYSFTASNGFAVNAGTYRITAVTLESTNYSVTLGTVAEFKITPKTIKLSGSWIIKNGTTTVAQPVYSKSNYTASTTIAADQVVSHLGTGAPSLTLVYSGNTNQNAGSYTTKVTGLSGHTLVANYELATSDTSYSWSIQKKVVTIKWNTTQLVYNGNVQAQSATVATGAASSTDGKAYETITVRCTGNEQTNAGTGYVAKAASLSNSNYEIDPATASYTWSIAKCPIDLDWENISFTYNGQIQYPIAVSDQNGDSIKVTQYTGHQNSQAGTYTVKATAVDNSNYTMTGGTNLSKTYTITPRTITVSWKAQYDGTSTTASATGLVYNDKSGKFLATVTNLCTGDQLTLNYTNNTFKNAGRYTPVISSLSGADAGNYRIDGINDSFEIAKKTVTIEWYWDNSRTESQPTFDGQLHTLHAVIKGAAGDDALTPVYSGNTTLPSGLSNAGSYDLTVKNVSDSTNYALTQETRTLRIKPQTAKVTWTGTESVVYNGTTHRLTASVTGTEKGKAVNVAFSYNNKFINAGNHTITINLSNDNYTLSANDRERVLVIDKQDVTLSWSGTQTLTYDGKAHTLQVSPRGELDGLTSTLVKALASKTDAGTYTLRAELSDSANYRFQAGTETEKTLTINPQKVTVKWTWSDVVYDGQNHSISAIVTGVSDGKSVNYAFTGNSIVKNAGTYTAGINLQNNNYTTSGVSNTTYSFTIKPRPVSISWSMAPTTYTGNAYSPAASVTNFAYGDSANSLTLQFTASYKNGSSYQNCQTIKDAATYRVTVSSLSGSLSGNYTLTGGTGLTTDFTIKPTSATVEWVSSSATYDGDSHDVLVNIYGVDHTLLQSNVRVGSYCDAGTYTFSTSGVTVSDANYVVPTTTQSFKVNPKTLTVNWVKNGNSTLTYEAGRSQGYEVKLGGIVQSDSGRVSITTSGNLTAINAGSYSVNITGLTGDRASNYVLDGSATRSNTYVIQKQSVTIKWSNENATVTDDGTLHKRTVDVCDSVSGTVLYSTYISNFKDNTILGAGTYTLSTDLSASVLSAEQQKNYYFTSESGDCNNTMIVVAAE